MKLLRTAIAVGVGVVLARRLSDEMDRRGMHAKLQRRSSGTTRPTPRVGTGTGTHTSAAAAASGAFRDDRDVVGVGALRDEEVAR